MSMFTLAISCLTTSNLPWFVDLTFQVPMQYCSLQHWTFTTKHVHRWASFLLWLNFFILSGTICPLFPSSILDTYQPGGLIFQFHISLPFHIVYEIRRCLLLGRKDMKCSTWMQSQIWQNDLCSFPKQTIQYHSNPVYAPISNAEEA